MQGKALHGSGVKRLPSVTSVSPEIPVSVTMAMEEDAHFIDAFFGIQPGSCGQPSLPVAMVASSGTWPSREARQEARDGLRGKLHHRHLFHWPLRQSEGHVFLHQIKNTMLNNISLHSVDDIHRVFMVEQDKVTIKPGGTHALLVRGNQGNSCQGHLGQQRCHFPFATSPFYDRALQILPNKPLLFPHFSVILTHITLLQSPITLIQFYLPSLLSHKSVISPYSAPASG